MQRQRVRSRVNLHVEDVKKDTWEPLLSLDTQTLEMQTLEMQKQSRIPRKAMQDKR
jgi:hypothetical protein